MDITDVQSWLSERLPAHLLAEPPNIAAYDDELVITLCAVAEGLAGEERQGAEQGVIEQLREQTRPLRMRLARELQRMTARPIAWGIRVGSSTQLFTTRSTPVMTRLGRVEREVLDILVAAGVADTRSAALGYVVRAFATEHSDWLEEARAALTHIEQVRARLKLSPGTGVPSTDSVASE